MSVELWEKPKESLKVNYPSLFAKEHDGKRSDKYAFVDTESIIDAFDKANWGISRVMTPQVRKADPEHCKHQVFFRPRGMQFQIQDPRGRPIYPEILEENSSNGMSALIFRAGLFIVVCSNGAVISSGDFSFFRKAHRNFTQEDAIDMAQIFLGKIDLLYERISKFSTAYLTPEVQLRFAEAAQLIRWGEKKVDSNKLLRRVREEDKRDDLWTIFNVVQEHLMNGGVATTRHRQTRGINNIRQYNDTNERLWELAETLL